jgi:flagellar biosynthetic protein FliR
MSDLAQLISRHWPELIPFLLVLGRTSGLMTSAPFWGGKTAPGLVRAVITFGISATTYPFVSVATSLPEAPNVLFLAIALAREVLVGLLLGWTAQLLFVGMRFAGHLIELKMGLGLAQLIDPNEGGQTSLFSILFDLIAVMIFLSLNGHHLLIRALLASYRVFPLADNHLSLVLVQEMVSAAGTLFVIALQVSAPVIVGLLLSDIALAIMARAVPHLNIFLIAPPLQLAFGMLLVLLSLPAVVWFCVNYLSTIGANLSALNSTILPGR